MVENKLISVEYIGSRLLWSEAWIEMDKGFRIKAGFPDELLESVGISEDRPYFTFEVRREITGNLKSLDKIKTYEDSEERIRLREEIRELQEEYRELIKDPNMKKLLEDLRGGNR